MQTASTKTASQKVKWDDVNIERGSGALYRETPQLKHSPAVIRSNPSDRLTSASTDANAAYTSPERHAPRPSESFQHHTPPPHREEVRKELFQETLDNLVGTVGGLFAGLGLAPSPSPQKESTIVYATAPILQPSVPTPPTGYVPGAGRLETYKQDISPEATPQKTPQQATPPKPALRSASSPALVSPAGNLRSPQVPTTSTAQVELSLQISKLQKKARMLEETFRQMEKRIPKKASESDKARMKQEVQIAEDEWQQCLYEINVATKNMLKQQMIAEEQLTALEKMRSAR